MNIVSITECILCGGPLEAKETPSDSFIVYRCKCEKCGSYLLDYRFYVTYRNGFEKQHELSSVSRYRNEYGHDNLLLDLDKYQEFLKDGDPFIRIPTLVSEKIDAFLNYLRYKSKSLGSRIAINHMKDYTLFFEDNYECVSYYLDHLIKEGYLMLGSQEGDIFNVILTVKAWDYTSEKNINSKQCFIAMSFDDKPELDSLYKNGFIPAIKKAGFKDFRVDKKDYDSTVTIDNRIISEINRSRFMIADFTDNKENVYYEAGYTKGLGIYVIYTCRKDFVEEVKFDIRNFPHITWSPNNWKDFADRLYYAIDANINKPEKT